MMQLTLSGDFSALAYETEAVMVVVVTHENHPAFDHAVGITSETLKPSTCV